MQRTYVSIIIPTYNDWERLALCVAALAVQSYPRDSFEVIIVNNKPDDNIPEGFTLPDHFRIVAEEKPGSYAARNKGLCIASGDIVGFTDSDCIPEPDWIKNAVLHFETNKNCSRIAGKIDFYFKEVKPNHVEQLESLFSFNQDKYVERQGMGVTANMFSRKSVFNTVGNFNEKLMSGGDLEWGRRANAAGCSIHYVATVIVKHPARSTFAELKSKARRVAGGHSQIGVYKKSTFLILAWKLILAFKPNLKETIFIYRQKKLGVKSKTIIWAMRYNLQVTRALEKFKVKRGKPPARF